MTTEEIVSVFQGKRKGSGWMAHCPAHDDGNASLSIKGGRDGRTLMFCQAGCELDAFLSAKGLSKRDLFADNENGSGKRTNPRPLNWDACVEAFGVAHVQRLADWRGFSGEFVSWLHGEKLIGISNGALAFAVKKGGHIVGCHYRPKDGKDWFYYPKGINAAPLVFGEILEGDTIHCFESTWDSLAFMDVSGDRSGIICTRGANNAKFVIEAAKKAATLYLWTQNDAPGAEWEKAILEGTQCTVKCVKIPTPYKDLNGLDRRRRDSE